jgi:hypothetical protein
MSLRVATYGKQVAPICRLLRQARGMLKTYSSHTRGMGGCKDVIEELLRCLINMLHVLDLSLL